MISIQEPVQAAVWHCLNHYAYADALFLAERLYAEVESNEALFLLATCYYRSGETIQAYMLLQNKGSPTPQCKYLMARCCMDLNKLSEAESVLGGSLLLKGKSVDDYVNEYGETACFTLGLLAKIYSKTEREAKAAEFYMKSLKLNPFLWSSFQNLCNIGEKPDVNKIFQVSAVQNLSFLKSPAPGTPASTLTTTILAPEPLNESPALQIMHQDNTPIASSIPLSLTNATQNETPENMEISDSLLVPPTAPKRTVRKKPGRNILGGSISHSPLTPSFGVLPLDTPSPGNSQNTLRAYITPSLGFGEVPQPTAPAKKMMTRRGQTPTKPPVFSQSATNTKDVQTPSPQAVSQNNAPDGVRRSSRLFSNNSNSVKENNKSQSRSRLLAPVRKSKNRLGKMQELNEINKPEKTPESKEKSSTITAAEARAAEVQKQSAVGLLNLLKEFGKAYVSLSQYDCQQAVELLSGLPIHHYYTGWVLSCVGRAYFEMTEYKKAEKTFCEQRRVAPHYFEGMETYSTTLWHLQKEVDLSTLSQELTDLDKKSPEAWCAAGNCFSLQKEHDTAIKFFQRAVQVDPDFAYAYTLLGHEYVLIEELDKAMACFRNAIRVDPRHYNAWYGVGMIYYKQEKFSLAEFNFRKALTINPQSSVLLCHIAVVQHALQKSDSALVTLNKAITVDPKNPLCKFHRASILFACDRHKEALAELEELKEIVPKESLVYFLIGKVQKKLGNTHLALMNFSWAVDLDPKGTNNQIKEAIDKRYVTDDDDVTSHYPDPGFEDSVMMDADDMQLQANESDESL